MHKFRRDVDHKLRVLQHADKIGDVGKACRYFGVGRASFYRWRTAYRQHGLAGRENRKTARKSLQPNGSRDRREGAVSAENLPPGADRVVWYLARYHAITISDAGVYRILRRHGLSRLPGGARVRKIHTQRYQKQVPGHQIQVDVKFLKFEGKDGKPVKRYQYTAIDDAARIRALKIYDRHNQSNAIDFINTIINKFPFRIREVRTEMAS